MSTFIALLRGINVGKAKRVPMATLRELLGGLGYTDVATLLNSGNAVFHASGGTAARHAADISAALSTQLKVDVAVIVLAASKLAAVVADNPIQGDADEHARLLVAFVPNAEALAGVATIEALVTPAEQFALGRHAAYLYCASGILDSKAGAALLGKAGQSATSRNWSTVLKLHALASAGS